MRWILGAVLALFMTSSYAEAGYVDFVRCQSWRGETTFCPLGTDIRRIDLAAQLSPQYCVYGNTWGYDGYNLWVTAGCRGDFRVERFGSQYPPPPPPGPRTLYCASNGYRNTCSAGGHIARAEVEYVHQGNCVYGRTWGVINGNQIWVDRGCQASFRVWLR